MDSETRGPNPSGLCLCGCGQRVPLARNTVAARGLVRGQPTLYVRGHSPRTAYSTFDQRYERRGEDECWPWTGRIAADGKPRFGGGSRLAHRVAYERSLGTLEAGDEVTQTCGNFLCVNPAHLALRRRDEPPPPNPSGLCMCGCGKAAPLARQTDRRLGYVRGQPVRYIRGHVGRLRRVAQIPGSYYRVEDRDYGTACWIWTRSYIGDYGRFTRSHVSVLAHRAMYEQEVGPIPDDWQIDHLCGQTGCVRPDHLEAVTRSEHAIRGRARAAERRVRALTEDDLGLVRRSMLPDSHVARLLRLPESEVARIRAE